MCSPLAQCLSISWKEGRAGDEAVQAGRGEIMKSPPVPCRGGVEFIFCSGNIYYCCDSLK